MLDPNKTTGKNCGPIHILPLRVNGLWSPHPNHMMQESIAKQEVFFTKYVLAVCVIKSFSSFSEDILITHS
jgi:hypothetical protein